MRERREGMRERRVRRNKQMIDIPIAGGDDDGSIGLMIGSKCPRLRLCGGTADGEGSDEYCVDTRGFGSTVSTVSVLYGDEKMFKLSLSGVGLSPSVKIYQQENEIITAYQCTAG